MGDKQVPTKTPALLSLFTDQGLDPGPGQKTVAAEDGGLVYTGWRQDRPYAGALRPTWATPLELGRD